MSYAMLASAGFNMAGGLFEFFGARKRAKYARKVQKYNNKMVRLSDANNQNAITVNAVQTVRQSARAALDIDIAGMEQEAEAAVSAATAGVAGNSVDAVMRNLSRSSAQAEYARKESLKAAYVSIDASRANSALSATMQQDTTHIQKPGIIPTIIGQIDNAQGMYKAVKNIRGKSSLPGNEKFSISKMLGFS